MDIGKHIFRFKIYLVLSTILTILYFPMSKKLLNMVLSQSINTQDTMFLFLVLIYSMVTLVIMIKLIKYLYDSAKIVGKKYPLAYTVIALSIPFVWIIVGIMFIRDLTKLSNPPANFCRQVSKKESII